MVGEWYLQCSRNYCSYFGLNGNYLDGKFDLTEIGKPFTVLSYWDKTNDTSSLVSPTPKPIDEWFFNPSTKVELFSPAINGTKIYHTSLVLVQVRKAGYKLIRLW